MALWRDTGKKVRFFGFDGRATIGILVFIFHPSWFTFYTFLGIFLAFGILERFNYTIPNAFRKSRSFLAGPLRRGVPRWRKKGYRSF